MLPSFSKRRQLKEVGLILVGLFVILLLIECFLLLSITQKEPVLAAFQRHGKHNVVFDRKKFGGGGHHKPEISFVIPSKLARPTLNRTLQSLLDQTHSNWEAIVGVDCGVVACGLNVNQTIAELSQAFVQDPRIHYLPIQTGSRFRGRKKNGAGQVRNAIIQDYARSDWVAMVDDDDTLSPYYAEAWSKALFQHSAMDIVVFRMQDPKLDSPLPPLDNTHFLQAKREYHLANREREVTWLGIGSVGISFAVRRYYWTKPQDRVIFVPHPSEDFNFLETAQTKAHAQVVLANCTLYFIRQAPLVKERRPVCHWDASVRISKKTIVVTRSETSRV